MRRPPLVAARLPRRCSSPAAAASPRARDQRHARRSARRAPRPQAAQGLGFPAIATKNTTRVGGADPVADAAAVAQAVFPAPPHPRGGDARRQRRLARGHRGLRAVRPTGRAPILFSAGPSLPAARRRAQGAGAHGLERPRPAAPARRVSSARRRRRGAQVRHRKADRRQDVRGADPFALGARDRRASWPPPRGKSSAGVLVVVRRARAVRDARRRLRGQERRPGAVRHARHAARRRPRRALAPTSSRRSTCSGRPA